MAWCKNNNAMASQLQKNRVSVRPRRSDMDDNAVARSSKKIKLAANSSPLFRNRPRFTGGPICFDRSSFESLIQKAGFSKQHKPHLGEKPLAVNGSDTRPELNHTADPIPMNGTPSRNTFLGPAFPCCYPPLT